MFDEAALVLEGITPEIKPQRSPRRACEPLHGSKKWDMAAAVASHLVKIEPENEGWWIGLAYSIRRSEGVEKPRLFCSGHKRYIPRWR